MMVEIKKIISELKPFKKQVVYMAVAGLVMSGTQSQYPLLLKKIFDALQTKDMNTFTQAAVVFVFFSLISGIGRYFNLFLMNYIAELVTTNLRRKLQQKFMRLNLSFYNNYASGSGGMISRILNDINIIFHGLRMVADFFREPILLFSLIAWLFFLNWKATSTIIILLPIILFFLQKISVGIRKFSEDSQHQLERITSIIKESLDGVRIIQSFNLENEMANRLISETDNYVNSRKKVHHRVEIAGPVTEFIATCLIIGLIVFFAFQISDDKATLGDFMGFVGALLMLNTPIKKLQESYVRLQETVVAAKRIYSILDEKSEVPQERAHKPFPKNWNSITYKNVNFSYGTEKILKDVNLTINKGEIVAFVGESGSGKSTLVNLIERFFDPTSGQILIDGTSIDEIDLKDLRKNIALVTQDVFLFSESIKRNIWAGDFSKEPHNIEEFAKSSNAHDFIMRTPEAYSSKVGDRGSLLSGGEKQRISIARALFKDAPVLILDEATSALDSASEIEVQKGLDQLMQGRTALVIAHRLSTVSKADRIVVLKSGSIVEVGTHKELLEKNGEYARFYRLQSH